LGEKNVKKLGKWGGVPAKFLKTCQTVKLGGGGGNPARLLSHTLYDSVTSEK